MVLVSVRVGVGECRWEIGVDGVVEADGVKLKVVEVQDRGQE